MPDGPANMLDQFTREVAISRRLVKTLDGLTAEARRRVLLAVADVYGFEIAEKPKAEGQ